LSWKLSAIKSASPEYGVYALEDNWAEQEALGSVPTRVGRHPLASDPIFIILIEETPDSLLANPAKLTS
jgi:hypothetical protein